MYYQRILDERELTQALILLGSANLKKAPEIRKTLVGLFDPSIVDQENKKIQKDLDYLASIQDVNWATVFSVDPKWIETDETREARRKNAVFDAYTKRPAL